MSERMQRRKRNTVTEFSAGYQHVHFNNGNIGRYAIPAQYVSEGQITDSEGHPWPPSNERAQGDIGGNFFTQRSQIERHPSRLDLDFREYDGTRHVINGYLTPCVIGHIPFATPPESNLNAAGATAIARCKPTNSVADVSTFLGELVKEGLPSIPGLNLGRDRTRQSLGGEHLNVEFGIKPIVNDVKKFLDAVRRADTVLEQYERDSGRMVRRKYRFPRTHSVSEEYLGYWAAPFGVQHLAAIPPGTVWHRYVRREITSHMWFSGAFTYHLPTGYHARKEMARLRLMADTVFGLNLTPDVLWNLAPWSWAVDWFSNTGDVVSNLTDWSTDGLVLRYGYIMEQVSVRETYTMRPSGSSYFSPHLIFPITFVTTTKRRRKANPFGFGVSDGDLTSRQLSIIAALGLSKS